MKKKLVAVCTAGCRLRNRAGEDAGPRPLSEDECFAHDDLHVSPQARALVRMLRDESPKVRQEVLSYFRKAGKEMKPVYSQLLVEDQKWVESTVSLTPAP